MTTQRSGAPSLSEIFFSCLKLGLISFGGPTAHLGYFHEEFVRRRQWLSDAEYGDLVALSQFLPGPASSQTIFAIGMQRHGWIGGLLASAGFTAPSAIVMILFAYGVSGLGQIDQAGWLQGLKLAATAVVAKAVIDMAKRLCPDLTRAWVAAAAASLLILFPNPWLQVLIILAGAIAGWRIGHHTTVEHPEARRPQSRLAPLISLAVFAILLVGLPITHSFIIHKDIALFDSFYRSGSLVFGGGHVVLPLLQAEVVPNAWVSNDAFLAGYGAAQAIPGPLFTFSAYLGTLARPGPGAWLGGIICLVAIFLPGWLLISAALPFWKRLRHKPQAQAALRGANAAVVGILIAAFYHPVCTNSIHGIRDVIHAGLWFALLKWSPCPPWLVVIIAAAAGQWL